MTTIAFLLPFVGYVDVTINLSTTATAATINFSGRTLMSRVQTFGP